MLPGLVLDTSALLTYADARGEVGDLIAKCADNHRSVLIPVLCLAEAYRQGPEVTAMFDLVAGLDNVTVVPAEPDMAPFLGGFTRTVGRMDLAQLAITAAERPLVPVMTSERKLITQILPSQWPIIDV